MTDPDLISLERFSALVADIYDCAIDPAGWPRVLAAMIAATGFVSGGLAVNALPSGRLLLGSEYGMSADWMERFEAYRHQVVEIWGGPAVAATASLDEVHVNSDYMPRDDLRRFAAYREFYEPQGLVDAAMMILAREAGVIATLGLNWPAGQGEIDERRRAFLRQLLPHLQRAVAIGGLLDRQTLAKASLTATLNGLGAGVALVGPGLEIVFANDALEDRLRGDGPLRRQRERLACDDPLALQALTLAVQQAARDETRIGRRGLGIPARSADAPPLLLHVLPLTRGDLRPGLHLQAVAAVFASDLVAGPEPAPELMATLFDLTPAEVRVFRLIAAGETREEAARALGIQLSTLKTHLVRIYAKTGTSRAAELARLAAQIARPL